MKRLNHKELENRIQNFMQRKEEEFPELRDVGPTQGIQPSATRDHSEAFRPTSRFVLPGHLSRV